MYRGYSFMKKVRPSAISLFCGAGGLSLGFKKAGFDIHYAIDKNSAAIGTYLENFKETFVECRNIEDVSFKKLKYTTLQESNLDILIGGPPCQGFSSAGSKWWDDPRNMLMKNYLNILSELNPRWFLFENVEGFITSNNGKYINEFLRRAISLGYFLRVHKLNLSHYGLPQKRKRVFIAGNRLGLNFEFPHPTHTDEEALTVMDAIGDLLIKSKSKKYKNIAYQNYLSLEIINKTLTDHEWPIASDIVRKRILFLKQGQDMRHLPEHLQHESYKRRAFRRVMDGTPTEKRGGAPLGVQRLHEGSPSKTITGASTREFIHPIENRFLTVRECARIQSFPDSFIFKGTQSQKILQIGNAVPPLISELIAKEIIKLGFLEKPESKTKKRSPHLLGYFLTKGTGMSPALKASSMAMEQLK